MSAKKTVIVFVHGANQRDKNENRNQEVWEESFQINAQTQREFLPLVNGKKNTEIAEFHQGKDPQRNFPEYIDWSSAWYGSIYNDLTKDKTINPFEENLNPDLNKERGLKLKKISDLKQRKVMEKFFDELVPFYELAVIKDENITFYEKICSKFLDDLIAATSNGQHDYVLVGHSMGCAVTYNVMSHISNEKKNNPYCTHNPKILSDAYRQKVKSFVETNSHCFGLMTFGNYTGYDWCQKLNNKTLYGELKEQFVYPDAVGKWFNYWTFLGGDPFILDDRIGDTMANNEEKNFKDVIIFRVPIKNVGHQRPEWFKRKNFVKNLVKKLKFNLYYN